MNKTKCETCNVLWILVCYYNEEEIAKFIETQVNFQSLRPKVVIVNNGTKNLNILDKLKKVENVVIIGDGKNLGYFGGANLALKYIKTDYDFVILTNSDILIPDKNFLKKLILKYNQNSNIGLIAPRIISFITNCDLNPLYAQRLSLRKLRFLNFIFSNYYLYLLYQTLSLFKSLLKGKILKPSSNKDIFSIYAPHGSFLIFTRTYFKRGGSLKFGAFLFGEELFVAELCRKLNLKILYDPSFKVIHNEHSTTGIFKSTKLVKYYHDSIKYIINFMKGEK